MIYEGFLALTDALWPLRVWGRLAAPALLGASRSTAVGRQARRFGAAWQTLAAHDLTRLRPYMRTHHVQPNVGHYGVFAGRRWQQHIYPVVRNVIQVSQ